MASVIFYDDWIHFRGVDCVSVACTVGGFGLSRVVLISGGGSVRAVAISVVCVGLSVVASFFELWWWRSSKGVVVRSGPLRFTQACVFLLASTVSFHWIVEWVFGRLDMVLHLYSVGFPMKNRGGGSGFGSYNSSVRDGF